MNKLVNSNTRWISAATLLISGIVFPTGCANQNPGYNNCYPYQAAPYGAYPQYAPQAGYPQQINPSPAAVGVPMGAPTGAPVGAPGTMPMQPNYYPQQPSVNGQPYFGR